MEKSNTNLAEILTHEDDIDFYDTITENDPVCFCGPMKLRPAGKAKYGEILNLPIILITKDNIFGNNSYSWAYLDTEELERRGLTEKQIRRTMHCLFNFLWTAAGYIDADEWDKLFDDDYDETDEAIREMEDNAYGRD